MERRRPNFVSLTVQRVSSGRARLSLLNRRLRAAMRLLEKRARQPTVVAERLLFRMYAYVLQGRQRSKQPRDPLSGAPLSDIIS